MKIYRRRETLKEALIQMERGDKMRVYGFDLNTLRSIVSTVNTAEAREMRVIPPADKNQTSFIVQW